MIGQWSRHEQLEQHEKTLLAAIFLFSSFPALLVLGEKYCKVSAAVEIKAIDSSSAEALDRQVSGVHE